MANKSCNDTNPFDVEKAATIGVTIGAAAAVGATAVAEGSLWKRWRTNKMTPPNLAPRSRTTRRHLKELKDKNTTNRSEKYSDFEMKEEAAIEAEEAAEETAIENGNVQSTVSFQKSPDSPPRGSVNNNNNSNPEPEQIVTPKVQDNDHSFFEQQTPPSFSPLPVMVSAKRLGKEVRRSHSKRRRPRSFQTTDKENNDAWNTLSNDNNHWTDSNSTPFTTDVDELAMNINDLSPEARANHYWTLCYGNQKRQQQSCFSANRAPPVKSCLSSTKKMKEPNLHITIKTPTISTRTHHNEATTPEPMMIAYSTPSPGQSSSSPTTPSRKVQFGDSMAAEFISEEPTVALTPMPVEISRVRFPIDETVSTKEEEAETEETKSNTSILSEWEEDFDDYIDDDEDDDEDLEGMLFSGTNDKQTKRHKSRSIDLCRRNSSIFSPSPGSKGLLLQDDSGSPPALAMMAGLQMDSPQMKRETLNHTDSPPRQLDAGFQQCFQKSSLMERLIMRQDIHITEALLALESRKHKSHDFWMWNHLERPVQKRIHDCFVIISEKLLKGITTTMEPKGILKHPSRWIQAQQFSTEELERIEERAVGKQRVYLESFGSQIEIECTKIIDMLTTDMLTCRIEKQMIAIAELERQIKMATETKIVLDYPWAGLTYLVTKSLLPFTLQTYSADFFSVTYRHEEFGLETNVCWTLSDQSQCIKVNTFNLGSVPADLFRALLCHKDGSICTMVQDHCQATNAQEFLNRFGALLGRIEDVGKDLITVMKRPFVKLVNVTKEDDQSIVLQISMDHDVEIQFRYARKTPFCKIDQVIPSCLTVLRNGTINADLEAVGTEQTSTASPSIALLQNVCDGIHKAMLLL